MNCHHQSLFLQAVEDMPRHAPQNLLYLLQTSCKLQMRILPFFTSSFRLVGWFNHTPFSHQLISLIAASAASPPSSIALSFHQISAFVVLSSCCGSSQLDMPASAKVQMVEGGGIRPLNNNNMSGFLS